MLEKSATWTKTTRSLGGTYSVPCPRVERRLFTGFAVRTARSHGRHGVPATRQLAISPEALACPHRLELMLSAISTILLRRRDIPGCQRHRETFRQSCWARIDTIRDMLSTNPSQPSWTPSAIRPKKAEKVVLQPAQSPSTAFASSSIAVSAYCLPSPPASCALLNFGPPIVSMLTRVVA